MSYNPNESAVKEAILMQAEALQEAAARLDTEGKSTRQVGSYVRRIKTVDMHSKSLKAFKNR